MEYRIIINLLDDTANQPSNFKTRNWVEINDESRGDYDEDDENINNNDDNKNNIKLQTLIISSRLCDYSDAYILVKGIITVPNTADAGAAVNNTNKKAVLKNCTPFSSCITEINNTEESKINKKRLF